MVLLEDAMALIEKVSTEQKKLIVVFDEFQEILNIRKGLDKQLRSIMQEQQHLNYILLTGFCYYSLPLLFHTHNPQRIQ